MKCACSSKIVCEEKFCGNLYIVKKVTTKDTKPRLTRNQKPDLKNPESFKNRTGEDPVKY